MSKELIEQLRDLANCRHDDLSIGCGAADRIEQLETERDKLRKDVALLWDLLSACVRTYPECPGEDDRKALAATEPTSTPTDI